MVIDRIEGDLVVCEAPSGATYAIPRAAFGPEVREGDVVVCGTNGELFVDAAATAARHDRIRALHEHLFS